MAIHVDLVENRWSSGYQERVGKVFEGASGVVVEPGGHYSELVLGNGHGPRAGREQQFLDDLADRYHSDYFFATQPHDDEECPFANGDRVQLDSAPAAQPAAHA
jgi:hypothetical protein